MREERRKKKTKKNIYIYTYISTSKEEEEEVSCCCGKQSQSKVKVRVCVRVECRRVDWSGASYFTLRTTSKKGKRGRGRRRRGRKEKKKEKKKTSRRGQSAFPFHFSHSLFWGLNCCCPRCFISHGRLSSRALTRRSSSTSSSCCCPFLCINYYKATGNTHASCLGGKKEAIRTHYVNLLCIDATIVQLAHFPSGRKRRNEL